MKKIGLEAKNKMSFWEKVYFKLDIPPDIINGIFIEIRGRTNVCVHGCRKLLIYTQETIKIQLFKCVLHIRGNGLYCTVYRSGDAEIDGVICSVEFEES